MQYYVRGVSGTISTQVADQALANLWNPASARRITVFEVMAFCVDFDSDHSTYYLRRTTAQGTAGSSATPGATDASDNAVAPPSGAVMGMCEYSVEPTLAALPGMYCPGPGNMLASGAGFLIQFPRGIIVPAGTGLAICDRLGSAFGAPWDLGFGFDD